MICSDKTGTLTTNKMTVRHVAVVETDEKSEVDGTEDLKVSDVIYESAGMDCISEYLVEGDNFDPIGKIQDLRSKMRKLRSFSIY